MSDLDRRIAQFQNMAQADPENEMAHFSLGRAFNEAGRYDEAAESFLRCTELAPSMSVAYQLAGEALLKVDSSGNKDKAAQLFTRGYTIAAERGEFKPRDAMAAALKSLGREVPQVAAKGKGGSRDVDLLGGGGSSSDGKDIDRSKYPPGTFFCTRTGRPGTKMAKPPFKGPVGQWIFENISQETFNAWIGQGTKVINEMRLDLSREQDADTYDEHMREYLGIDEELYEKLMAGVERR